MGIFIKHSPCPKCGSRDNLAEYSDGGGFCFGCGYNPQPTTFNPSNTCLESIKPTPPKPILGSGSSSPIASSWASKYGITTDEFYGNGWGYSRETNQAIFPIKDENQEVVCYQARNFYKGAKSKYTNYGDKERGHAFFGGGKSVLVLTEDVLSAIKVFRFVDSLALLGTHLSDKKLSFIKPKKYTEVSVWLDPDKWKEAIAITKTLQLVGYKSRAILSEKDPKEHTNEEIVAYLQLDKS